MSSSTTTATSCIWFVSDVHLYYEGTDYLRQFIEFLEAARTGCDELYIVGDLFEFWIGDRQGRFDFYRPLFETIRSLVAGGVAIRIIHGNRDFLMGRRFEDFGATILPDEVELDLGGERVHLSHGDQFCLHDVSYQRARKVFRSRPVRFVSKILPGPIGLFLARSYRRISERKKAKKKSRYGTGNRYWTIEEGVRGEFERGDHDVVVCGHIHFMQDAVFDIEGRSRRVITTGAWEEGPNYVVFDPSEGLSLRRFDPPSGRVIPDETSRKTTPPDLA